MNRKIEFFILKRNPKKGSFWQSVSGGVKLHQSLSEAAVAELGEELGIIVDLNRLLDAKYVFYYTHNAEISYIIYDYLFFYNLEEQEIVLLSDEHVDSMRGDISDVVPMLKYDSSRKSFELVHKLLFEKQVL